MKKCPFCAEEIQDEAVKCRFCGEFLDGRLRAGAPSKQPWYFKTSTLIVGFLVVGPLIIPVVWYNPAYSKAKKIIITIVFIIITVFLYRAAKHSMSVIKDYYQIIQGDYQSLEGKY